MDDMHPAFQNSRSSRKAGLGKLVRGQVLPGGLGRFHYQSHFLFIRSEILVVRIGLVELFGSNRVIKHVFQFEQCKINCIAVGDIIQYHTRRYVNVINFHNDNLSTLENLMCSFRFVLKKTVFDVFCILDSSLELLKEMCVQ